MDRESKIFCFGFSLGVVSKYIYDNIILWNRYKCRKNQIKSSHQQTPNIQEDQHSLNSQKSPSSKSKTIPVKTKNQILNVHPECLKNSFESKTEYVPNVKTKSDKNPNQLTLSISPIITSPISLESLEQLQQKTSKNYVHPVEHNYQDESKDHSASISPKKNNQQDLHLHPVMMIASNKGE
jgi:hypothetical protein